MRWCLALGALLLIAGCGPKVRTETKTVATKTVTQTNTKTTTLPARTVSTPGLFRTVATPPPPPPPPPLHTALPPGVTKIDVSHFLVDPVFKSSIGKICTRGDNDGQDSEGNRVHRPPGIWDLSMRGAYFFVTCRANQKQY